MRSPLISETFDLKKEQLLPLLSATLLAAGYICFDAVRNRSLGAALFAAALLPIARLQPSVRRYLASLLLATIIVAIAPLTTKYTFHGLIIVVGMMAGAVAVIYVVSRYLERQQLVHFNLDWRRPWRPWEIAYIVVTVAAVYLLMPYYFKSTGAVHSWYFERHIGEIVAVFCSTMIIGIWEEFFFTASVLGVLRKYMPFGWANCLQSCMFVGFLYAIGFRYWAPIGLFCYAWAQGWVFNKTRSLLFVLVVHICVDLLVCLVLLHAYYPDMARIFITG